MRYSAIPDGRSQGGREELVGEPEIGAGQGGRRARTQALRPPRSSDAAAPGRRDAGELPQEEGPADVSIRLLAVAGSRLGWPELLGPENGAISEKLVYEAAREAHAKSYSHLYVIGFAIQPVARTLVDNCEAVAGVPATYVQATPDLMMGELLKNMRSSQIFSVCGLPEVRLRRA